MKKVILGYLLNYKKEVAKVTIFLVMLSALNYAYFDIKSEVKPKETKIEKSSTESLVLFDKDLRENSRIVAKVIGIPSRKSTYSGLSKTQALVALEIKSHFKGSLYKKAIVVAWCESRLDPKAVNKNRNGTVDRGVFQINDGGTMQQLGITAKEAFDYNTNIRAAKKLFNDRGWQPWVCSKKIKKLA